MEMKCLKQKPNDLMKIKLLIIYYWWVYHYKNISDEFSNSNFAKHFTVHKEWMSLSSRYKQIPTFAM